MGIVSLNKKMQMQMQHHEKKIQENVIKLIVITLDSFTAR